MTVATKPCISGLCIVRFEGVNYTLKHGHDSGCVSYFEGRIPQLQEKLLEHINKYPWVTYQLSEAGLYINIVDPNLTPVYNSVDTYVLTTSPSSLVPAKWDAFTMTETRIYGITKQYIDVCSIVDGTRLDRLAIPPEYWNEVATCSLNDLECGLTDLLLLTGDRSNLFVTGTGDIIATIELPTDEFYYGLVELDDGTYFSVHNTRTQAWMVNFTLEPNETKTDNNYTVNVIRRIHVPHPPNEEDFWAYNVLRLGDTIFLWWSCQILQLDLDSGETTPVFNSSCVMRSAATYQDGFVILTNEETVFVDQQGQVYLTWSHGGGRIAATSTQVGIYVGGQVSMYKVPKSTPAFSMEGIPLGLTQAYHIAQWGLSMDLGPISAMVYSPGLLTRPVTKELFVEERM